MATSNVPKQSTRDILDAVKSGSMTVETAEGRLDALRALDVLRAEPGPVKQAAEATGGCRY